MKNKDTKNTQNKNNHKNKPRLSPKPELETKHTKTHSLEDSSSRRLNRGKKTNPDSATEDLSLDLSLG